MHRHVKQNDNMSIFIDVADGLHRPGEGVSSSNSLVVTGTKPVDVKYVSDTLLGVDYVFAEKIDVCDVSSEEDAEVLRSIADHIAVEDELVLDQVQNVSAISVTLICCMLGVQRCKALKCLTTTCMTVLREIDLCDLPRLIDLGPSPLNAYKIFIDRCDTLSGAIELGPRVRDFTLQRCSAINNVVLDSGCSSEMEISISNCLSLVSVTYDSQDVGTLACYYVRCCPLLTYHPNASVTKALVLNNLPATSKRNVPQCVSGVLELSNVTLLVDDSVKYSIVKRTEKGQIVDNVYLDNVSGEPYQVHINDILDTATPCNRYVHTLEVTDCGSINFSYASLRAVCTFRARLTGLLPDVIARMKKNCNVEDIGSVSFAVNEGKYDTESEDDSDDNIMHE